MSNSYYILPPCPVNSPKCAGRSPQRTWTSSTYDRPMAGAENYGMIAGYAAGERGARAAAREGMAVVVVDAFRASTTIAVFVRKGARVIPVASIEEAVDYAGPTAVSGGVAARKCGASFWELADRDRGSGTAPRGNGSAEYHQRHPDNRGRSRRLRDPGRRLRKRSHRRRRTGGRRLGSTSGHGGLSNSTSVPRNVAAPEQRRSRYHTPRVRVGYRFLPRREYRAGRPSSRRRYLREPAVEGCWP